MPQSQTVKELLQEIQKQRGAEGWSAPIAALKDLAASPEASVREEAVKALTQLWLQQILPPEDLVPYSATVVDQWKQAYATLLPLQQEPVTAEWLCDGDYSGLSGDGEILLDLMGYLPGPEIEQHLREALRLTDPRLKVWAARSLLRRDATVPPEEIEAIAANDLVRITLWEFLRMKKLESLMPERWATPIALSASDLTRWLTSATELNAIPEEMEYVESYWVKDDDDVVDQVHLFKFREFPKPWEPGEGWMAGLAGPYKDGEQLDSPWSQFRRWDSMEPYDHFDMLYQRTSGPPRED
jgi:hypothetical protein